MTIFKAYDIRGKYPEEINEAIAYKIGRAFVTFTKCKDVMVGIDARTHSSSLADALIRGLTDQGATVTYIGLSTTPQTIAMHMWREHECAIMVTASHLDAPFNGFKMYTQGGRNITERYGMKELAAFVQKDVFISPAKKGVVHVKTDYTAEYARRIIELSPLNTAPLFVVDCSNGSVGPELAEHLRNPGLQLVVLNSEPDGTFPNHSPNPIAPHACDQAAAEIKKRGAVGGCVFDADADRITFLDETGKPVHPNFISCLLIQHILKHDSGRIVAYDLISSRVLPETISAAGGKPLRTRVGRNLLADDMREHKAVFAAESSSHMIYEKTAYADSSTLSLRYMLTILNHAQQPLSALVRPFAKYFLLLETNYHIENPDHAIEAIEAAFPEATLDYLDGVTLTWPDGWVVARKSNTEPLLRIRAEADTADRLQEIKGRVEAVILRLGGSWDKGNH